MRYWRKAPPISRCEPLGEIRTRRVSDSTEALVSETHAPDDAYEALRQHFSEDEALKER
jgi:hypothetical protein